MPIVTYESTGPRGEELAMAAGDAAGIAVGWDSEFDSATFDSDDAAGEAELRATVEEALAAIDADWASELRLAE